MVIKNRHAAYKKLSSNQTRFCFDPWIVLNIKADGNVYPCCRSRFSFGCWKDISLKDIIMSEVAIEFKQGLLEGGEKLHPDCMSCPRKAPISVDEFKVKFIARLEIASNETSCE